MSDIPNEPDINGNYSYRCTKRDCWYCDMMYPIQLAIEIEVEAAETMEQKIKKALDKKYKKGVWATKYNLRHVKTKKLYIK